MKRIARDLGVNERDLVDALIYGIPFFFAGLAVLIYVLVTL